MHTPGNYNKHSLVCSGCSRGRVQRHLHLVDPLAHYFIDSNKRQPLLTPTFTPAFSFSLLFFADLLSLTDFRVPPRDPAHSAGGTARPWPHASARGPKHCARLKNMFDNPCQALTHTNITENTGNGKAWLTTGLKTATLGGGANPTGLTVAKENAKREQGPCPAPQSPEPQKLPR